MIRKTRAGYKLGKASFFLSLQTAVVGVSVIGAAGFAYVTVSNVSHSRAHAQVARPSPTERDSDARSLRQPILRSYEEEDTSLQQLDHRLLRHLEKQKEAVRRVNGSSDKDLYPFPRTRAFISKCHRDDACNGLGDRLYGIVNLFLAALLTDRLFFIDHDKPLPLENYLQPNVLDWRLNTLPMKSLKRLTSCTGCSSRTSLGGPHSCHMLVKTLYSSIDVIQTTTTHRPECLVELLNKATFFPVSANGSGLSDREKRLYAGKVAHRIFHHLFKFSPLVETATNELLSHSLSKHNGFAIPPPRDCMLCIHARRGLGTSEPTKGHKNLNDFMRCAIKAEAYMMKKRWTTHCPATHRPVWVVISDDNITATNLSHIAKQRGETNITFVSTNNLGPIIHVSADLPSVEVTKKGLLRVFVDFNLLSGCKHLVASMSTFSGMASFVHGVETRRFDMALRTPCEAKPKTIGDWQDDRNLLLEKFEKEKQRITA